MDLDRQRLERCLEQVVAYRASGLKATAWAAANEVELRELQSWCAHSKRWRARLDGVALAPPPAAEWICRRAGAGCAIGADLNQHSG